MDKKEMTNILSTQLNISKERYTEMIDAILEIIYALTDRVDKLEDVMRYYCYLYQEKNDEVPDKDNMFAIFMQVLSENTEPENPDNQAEGN